MRRIRRRDLTPKKAARLYRWLEGETPGPCLVTIFPTNRCNMRCTICWQRWSEFTYDEVPDERWLRLIDEGAEMRVWDWIIVGGGEPMVRADLVMQLCDRICRHGMDGALHTNGTLFTRDHIEHLIDIGLRRVVVSLDGPNAEINDRIRTKGSFQKATENLRLFKELKRKRRARLPETSLLTTLTNLNYDKLDQMVDLARELGCEEGVTLSNLIVQEEVCASFDLSEEQRAEFPMHLRRAMRRGRWKRVLTNFRRFLPENQATLSRMEVAEDASVSLGRIAQSRCFEPWLSTSITSDGKVGPCCAFWAEDADNIRNMSLREVWLGPYMEKVRRQLVIDDLPEYCLRCPYTIVVRNEALRARLLWRQRQLELRNQSRLQAANDLAARTVGSLRRDGLVRTVRRAGEWLVVRLRE